MADDKRADNVRPRKSFAPRNDITAERVRQLLVYDPATGIFRRRTASSNARAGDIAGYIHRRTGYVIIRLDGKRYLGHRLAWLYQHGEWPPEELDHENLLRSDNRVDGNLRPASHEQNMANIPIFRSNRSGYKGVHWNKNTKKWRAVIRVKGKLIHLGLFESPAQAHEAYARATKERRGKYGRLR